MLEARAGQSGRFPRAKLSLSSGTHHPLSPEVRHSSGYQPGALTWAAVFSFVGALWHGHS